MKKEQRRNNVSFTTSDVYTGRDLWFITVEFKTNYFKYYLNEIISLKPLYDNIHQFLYLQKIQQGYTVNIQGEKMMLIF